MPLSLLPSGGVRLAWTLPASAAPVGFAIDRASTPAAGLTAIWETIAALDANARSYDDLDAPPGWSLRYRVVALYGVSPSNFATITTPAAVLEECVLMPGGPVPTLNAAAYQGTAGIALVLGLAVDQPIASWMITWGDGTSDQGTALPPTAAHVYPAGPFTLRFKVVTAAGLSGCVQAPVVITDISPAPAPATQIPAIPNALPPAPPGGIPPPPPPNPVTLVSVAVTGPGIGTVGQTLGYRAIATYSDGSQQDVTAGGAFWASSALPVATITKVGQVLAVAPGTTLISVRLGTLTSPGLPLTVSAVPPPAFPGLPTLVSPASGAQGLPFAPASALQWSSVGATTYAVAFGTSPTPPTVTSGLAASAYLPGTLLPSTTYYWQIVATNASGSTPGPVWSFMTQAAGAPPPPPPPGAPPTLTILCPLPVAVVSHDGGATPVTWPDATFDGGLAPVVLTYTKSVSTPVVSGAAFTVGVTPVTAHVASADGQVATCTFNVVVTAPPAPPIPPPAPGTQRVLNVATDFSLVGFFKSPAEAAGGIANGAYMTCRRVGGNLQFLWLVNQGLSGGDLIETSYPGYDPTTVTTKGRNGTLLHNYGHGYQALFQFYDGSFTTNNTATNSITWDPHNNCLWLQFAAVYGTGTAAGNPFLIRGDINDTTHTIAWSGPWRFSGTTPNSTAQPSMLQCQSTVAIVPPAYGATYLGGATIACGAGHTTGDIGNSFAPVLWAPAITPNAATPTFAPDGSHDLPAVCLLGGDFQHRGRRPGNYLDLACGGSNIGALDPTSFSRTALTGWWNAVGNWAGSALWFNWADIRGVLFMATMNNGHNFYANPFDLGGPYVCAHGKRSLAGITGPVNVVDPVGDAGQVYGQGSNEEPFFYVYDEHTFVQVLGGNAFDVPPNNWGFASDLMPDFAYCKHADAYAFNSVFGSGVCADETLRLVFFPQPTYGQGDVDVSGGLGFYINVVAVAP